MPLKVWPNTAWQINFICNKLLNCLFLLSVFLCLYRFLFYHDFLQLTLLLLNAWNLRRNLKMKRQHSHLKWRTLKIIPSNGTKMDAQLSARIAGWGIFLTIWIFLIIVIIILYFENVAFFHAKLGSDVCPRVDSGDTLQDLTRPLDIVILRNVFCNNNGKMPSVSLCDYRTFCSSWNVERQLSGLMSNMFSCFHQSN